MARGPVDDRNDLGRFLEAQQTTYDRAVAELRAGHKTGHWIWWIFPQLRGLGLSVNSTSYGIDGLREATEYAGHPLLSARLRECVQLVLDTGASAVDVLGSVDAMKLRSSLTLFIHATEDPSLFRAALDRLYDGAEDPETIRLLGVTD